MLQPVFKGKARAVGGADNQIPNPQPPTSDTANEPATSAPFDPVLQDQNKLLNNAGSGDQRLKDELERLLKVMSYLRTCSSGCSSFSCRTLSRTIYGPLSKRTQSLFLYLSSNELSQVRIFQFAHHVLNAQYDHSQKILYRQSFKSRRHFLNPLLQAFVIW